MNTNQVILALNPNWGPPPAGQNLVLFIQACTSSNALQRVVVSGEGLPEPVTKTSIAGMPYGAQYLNYEIVLPSSTLPYPNWRWTVEVSHSPDEGVTWNNSDVKGSDATSMVNGLMYVVYALSNDDGNDQDYNDTVVQISVFNNSAD